MRLLTLLLVLLAASIAAPVSPVAIAQAATQNRTPGRVTTFAYFFEVEDYDAFSVVVPLPPPEGAFPWAKFRSKCYAFDQDYKPLSQKTLKFDAIEHKFDGMTNRYLRITFASQIVFGKRPTKVTVHSFIETTMVAPLTVPMPSNAVFDGNRHMPGLPVASWAPRKSGEEQVMAVIKSITDASKAGGRIWPYAVQHGISPLTIEAWRTPTDCEGSAARFVSALRAGGVPAWVAGGLIPSGWHAVAVYVLNGKAYFMDVESLIGRSEPALTVAQDWTIPTILSMPATAGFEVHPGLRSRVSGKKFAGKSYLTTSNLFYFKIGGKARQHFSPKVHPDRTIEDVMPPEESWKPLEVTLPKNSGRPADMPGSDKTAQAKTRI